MKKCLALILIAVSLMLCSCEKQDPIEVRPDTPAPTDSSEVFFPQNTPQRNFITTQDGPLHVMEAGSDFFPDQDGKIILGLTYNLPVFSEPKFAAVVNSYIAELRARIQNDILPLCDGMTASSADAVCEVVYSGDYITLVILETVTVGVNTEQELFTVALNKDGLPVSLYDISGQFLNKTELSKRLLPLVTNGYPDLVYGDISDNLNLYGGFSVHDGAYRFYFQPGQIAETEKGFLYIELPSEKLTPPFLDEYLTYAQQAELIKQIQLLAMACAPDDIEFVESPGPLFATCYMSQYMLDKGLKSMPESEFKAVYKSAFGRDFPGINDQFYDLKLSGGTYTLDAYRENYNFGIMLESVSKDGSVLSLKGSLMHGAPGAVDAVRMYGLTVKIKLSGAGYTIVYYK